MRKLRFFSERLNLRIGSSVKLPDNESTHIRSVLRLKKDSNIIIFNGEKEFKAKLTLVSKKAVMAKIISLERVIDSKSCKVTLFQSLLRAGKFDIIIKRTTELGITKIVPFESDFSQSKKESISQKKLDRWNNIAVSASKQSQRIDIPFVNAPIKFFDIKKMLNDFDLILFCVKSKKSKNLLDIDFKKYKSVCIIIGPEGGFSRDEVEFAQNLNVTFVTFNKNILTSETAAISSVGIIYASLINT